MVTLYTWPCDALPPTSTKLASVSPCNLTISMVAMANPAPFTRPQKKGLKEERSEQTPFKRTRQKRTKTMKDGNDKQFYTSLGSSCVVSRCAYIYFCINAALSSKFNFASATTSLLSDVSARGFIYNNLHRTDHYSEIQQYLHKPDWDIISYLEFQTKIKQYLYKPDWDIYYLSSLMYCIH